MVGISYHTYNPVKTLELGPSIYAASKLPKTIDIQSKGHQDTFSIKSRIINQTAQNLPFILSIKLDDEDKPEIYTAIQKTGLIFYFMIHSIHEDTFHYLGKSNERNAEIKSSLLKFFEFYENQDRLTFKWLKYVANDHKRPEDQYLLAKSYGEGIGTEKNLREAVRYCKLAAKQTHKGAMFALATHYVSHHCDPKRYKSATLLIQKLTKLNYGKALTRQRVISWIDQLDKDMPEFFKKAVGLLLANASSL